MKIFRTLLYVGILMALLPWTGFPLSWKEVIGSFLGIFVAYISFSEYKKMKESSPIARSADTFTETVPAKY